MSLERHERIDLYQTISHHPLRRRYQCTGDVVFAAHALCGGDDDRLGRTDNRRIQPFQHKLGATSSDTAYRQYSSSSLPFISFPLDTRIAWAIIAVQSDRHASRAPWDTACHGDGALGNLTSEAIYHIRHCVTYQRRQDVVHPNFVATVVILQITSRGISTPFGKVQVTAVEWLKVTGHGGGCSSRSMLQSFGITSPKVLPIGIKRST
jgi:hypothetical protein